MVTRRAGGQSLIEVVFSVGVIVLVLTAVVSLMISSLHSRTTGYDRKKADELGQTVMEQLVEIGQTSPEDFWNVSSAFWAANKGISQTMSGYDGYNYMIDFVGETNIGTSCPPSPIICANATVNVGYSSNNGNNVVFTRFFNR
jgi:Tfp pilus assembly protein PilV